MSKLFKLKKLINFLSAAADAKVRQEVTELKGELARLEHEASLPTAAEACLNATGYDLESYNLVCHQADEAEKAEAAKRREAYQTRIAAEKAAKAEAARIERDRKAADKAERKRLAAAQAHFEARVLEEERALIACAFLPVVVVDAATAVEAWHIHEAAETKAAIEEAARIKAAHKWLQAEADRKAAADAAAAEAAKTARKAAKASRKKAADARRKAIKSRKALKVAIGAAVKAAAKVAAPVAAPKARKSRAVATNIVPSSTGAAKVGIITMIIAFFAGLIAFFKAPVAKKSAAKAAYEAVCHGKSFRSAIRRAVKAAVTAAEHEATLKVALRESIVKVISAKKIWSSIQKNRSPMYTWRKALSWILNRKSVLTRIIDALKRLFDVRALSRQLAMAALGNWDAPEKARHNLRGQREIVSLPLSFGTALETAAVLRAIRKNRSISGEFNYFETRFQNQKMVIAHNMGGTFELGHGKRLDAKEFADFLHLDRGEKCILITCDADYICAEEPRFVNGFNLHGLIFASVDLRCHLVLKTIDWLNGSRDVQIFQIMRNRSEYFRDRVVRDVTVESIDRCFSKKEWSKFGTCLGQKSTTTAAGGSVEIKKGGIKMPKTLVPLTGNNKLDILNIKIYQLENQAVIGKDTDLSNQLKLEQLDFLRKCRDEIIAAPTPAAPNQAKIARHKIYKAAIEEARSARKEGEILLIKLDTYSSDFGISSLLKAEEVEAGIFVLCKDGYISYYGPEADNLRKSQKGTKLNTRFSGVSFKLYGKNWAKRAAAARTLVVQPTTSAPVAALTAETAAPTAIPAPTTRKGKLLTKEQELAKLVKAAQTKVDELKAQTAVVIDTNPKWVKGVSGRYELVYDRKVVDHPDLAAAQADLAAAQAELDTYYEAENKVFWDKAAKTKASETKAAEVQESKRPDPSLNTPEACAARKAAFEADRKAKEAEAEKLRTIAALKTQYVQDYNPDIRATLVELAGEEVTARLDAERENLIDATIDLGYDARAQVKKWEYHGDYKAEYVAEHGNTEQREAAQAVLDAAEFERQKSANVTKDETASAMKDGGIKMEAIFISETLQKSENDKENDNKFSIRLLEAAYVKTLQMKDSEKVNKVWKGILDACQTLKAGMDMEILDLHAGKLAVEEAAKCVRTYPSVEVWFDSSERSTTQNLSKMAVEKPEATHKWLDGFKGGYKSTKVTKYGEQKCARNQTPEEARELSVKRVYGLAAYISGKLVEFKIDPETQEKFLVRGLRNVEIDNALVGFFGDPRLDSSKMGIAKAKALSELIDYETISGLTVRDALIMFKVCREGRAADKVVPRMEERANRGYTQGQVEVNRAYDELVAKKTHDINWEDTFTPEQMKKWFSDKLYTVGNFIWDFVAIRKDLLRVKTLDAAMRAEQGVWNTNLLTAAKLKGWWDQLFAKTHMANAFNYDHKIGDVEGLANAIMNTLWLAKNEAHGKAGSPWMSQYYNNGKQYTVDDVIRELCENDCELFYMVEKALLNEAPRPTKSMIKSLVLRQVPSIWKDCSPFDTSYAQYEGPTGNFAQVVGDFRNEETGEPASNYGYSICEEPDGDHKIYGCAAYQQIRDREVLRIKSNRHITQWYGHQAVTTAYGCESVIRKNYLNWLKGFQRRTTRYYYDDLGQLVGSEEILSPIMPWEWVPVEGLTKTATWGEMPIMKWRREKFFSSMKDTFGKKGEVITYADIYKMDRCLRATGAAYVLIDAQQHNVEKLATEIERLSRQMASTEGETTRENLKKQIEEKNSELDAAREQYKKLVKDAPDTKYASKYLLNILTKEWGGDTQKAVQDARELLSSIGF